ncbi:D-mannose binding lectin [Lutibacter sp. Hel_I_33_5]|uniref:hypothetical protein n=1 Tax=Lutibacter sp. Hel_I_33_5 TaxID=1566289 RepID=UPI00119CC4A8|nr:hypothetical protein [Lutibacter sp. Hel_I_33_5]TVZ56762.1 D-mannose binding lectin [Lutibacter sp. Hel_I_33_5]
MKKALTITVLLLINSFFIVHANSTLKKSFSYQKPNKKQNRNTLKSGENLHQNEFLQSKNGLYKLILHQDGNLVVHYFTGKHIWSSNSKNKGGVRLLMRDDGILTIYKKNKSHAWSSSKKKNKGKPFLIMQNDGNAVVYINKNSKKKAVWSSGSFKGRKKYSPQWMQNSLDIIGDKKISEITIVGSHDSGANTRNGGTSLSNDCNTNTQSKNIFDQLSFGARYFDIRPVISNGKFYTGHYGKLNFNVGEEITSIQNKAFNTIKKGIEFSFDLIPGGKDWVKKELKNKFKFKTPSTNSWQGANGQKITEIVKDINRFTEVNSELIILNLSHSGNTDVGNADYRKFNKGEWDNLFKELSNIKHLYIASNKFKDINSLIINDLIRGKSTVIIIMDKENMIPKKYLNKGFFNKSSFKVIDKYSNSNNLNNMFKDQREKMNKNIDGYFLLSWTLTQDKNQIVKCLLDNKIRIPYIDVKEVYKKVKKSTEELIKEFGANIANLAEGKKWKKIKTGTKKIKKHKDITLFKRKSIIDLANEANKNLNKIENYITQNIKPNIIYVDNITDNKAAKLANKINQSVKYYTKKGSSLSSNKELKKGEFIVSPDGSFKLIMQDDGNLVIYNMFKKATWSSKTSRKSGVKLRMRDDGILTVYKKDNSHAWSSGKKKDAKPKGKYVLKMQDDGNAVVYDKKNKAIWSSKTNLKF